MNLKVLAIKYEEGAFNLKTFQDISSPVMAESNITPPHLANSPPVPAVGWWVAWWAGRSPHAPGARV